MLNCGVLYGGYYMARQGKRPPESTPAESRLALNVRPGAKRNEVLGMVEGVLKVKVAASAREGKANEALIDLIASLLDVPKRRIRILHGFAARNKVVAVQGVRQEDALRRLGVG